MSPTPQESLQQQLDEFEAAVRQRLSRFERLLIAANLIDTTKGLKSTTQSTAQAVNLTPRKDRFVAGIGKEDPQYSVDVTYCPASGDDDIFTEPLVNPTAGSYLVRFAVTQHHAGLLFQGFELRARLPAGWSFADSHGEYTVHEFISNPTVIVRKASYSSGTKGFKGVVSHWYRP